MEKDHSSIKKVVIKIYKINQRLKSWALVPIAVRLRPAASHRNRWTFRIQKYPIIAIFTVFFFNVTFTNNWQNLRSY